MKHSKNKYNFAKIASWNIHGIFYKVNNFRINKLEDTHFLGILNYHDMLCLQETHCGQNETPIDHISHFTAIPHCRKKSSNNRYFGGMLLLIRKTIRKGIKVTYTADPDILGITLNKEFFGLEKELIVWFVYAPPVNSPYTKSRERVLGTLERLLAMNNNCMIMGDLNGKTSVAADFVNDMTDNHSPIIDIETYI